MSLTVSGSQASTIDSVLAPDSPEALSISLPADRNQLAEQIKLRRIVVLGPPGGGKGTLADALAADLGICHLSTGDVLRAEVKSGSALGKSLKEIMDRGELVPFQIVVDIVVNRLQQPDCAKGYLLDGSPRRVAEAEALEKRLAEKHISTEIAIDLQVPDSDIQARLEGRRLCPKCGAIYHVSFKKPRVDGKCDLDGTALIQRSDDNASVIAERLKVYHQETAPVSGFYESRGLRTAINARGSASEVEALVLKILWRPDVFGF